MRFYAFRQRTFLNPTSTDSTSYIHAMVESSRDGQEKWGANLVLLADCRKRIEYEFCLGTRKHRRQSLAKINLLIKVLTRFRNALMKEIASIEKAK